MKYANKLNNCPVCQREINNIPQDYTYYCPCYAQLSGFLVDSGKDDMIVKKYHYVSCDWKYYIKYNLTNKTTEIQQNDRNGDPDYTTIKTFNKLLSFNLEKDFLLRAEVWNEETNNNMLDIDKLERILNMKAFV